MSNSYYPVILFCYNRPEHTYKTLKNLSVLKESKCTDIHIFCDGSKNYDDKEQIKRVREIVTSSSWQNLFNSISIHTSENNKGLARSIVEGVSLILENEKAVIVLEDDLIVSKDFLSYMNKALNYYYSDSVIGSIAAYSSIKTFPKSYKFNFYLLPRSSSTGWATWQNRWKMIDWSDDFVIKFLQNNKSRKVLDSAGNDRSYRALRLMKGQISSWSIRFGISLIANNQLTIYPSVSKIKNIGYDGSGSNTDKNDLQNLNNTISNKLENYNFQNIDVNSDILKLVHKAYSGPLYRQIIRYFKVKYMLWKLGK